MFQKRSNLIRQDFTGVANEKLTNPRRVKKDLPRRSSDDNGETQIDAERLSTAPFSMWRDDESD
jgi:hypothetical protein